MRRIRPGGAGFAASALGAALAAALALSGCAPSGVCPAIGWMNSLDVRVAGEAASIAVLEVCAGEVCGRSLPEITPGTPALTEVSTPSSLNVVEPGQLPRDALPGPGIGEATAPGGEPDRPRLPIARIAIDTWRIDVGMSAPTSLTVRALADSGEELAEWTLAPSWRRVGGSERCGGPEVAEEQRLELAVATG